MTKGHIEIHYGMVEDATITDDNRRVNAGAH